MPEIWHIADRDAVHLHDGVLILDLLVLEILHRRQGTDLPQRRPGRILCAEIAGGIHDLRHLVDLAARCDARRWPPVWHSRPGSRACPATRRSSCPGSVRHSPQTAPGHPAPAARRCPWPQITPVLRSNVILSARSTRSSCHASTWPCAITSEFSRSYSTDRR